MWATDFVLVTLGQAVPEASDSHGPAVRAHDVVEGQESMRKASVDLKVPSNSLLAMVGVDKDEINMTESRSPLEKFFRVRVSPEDLCIIGKVDGHAAGPRVALIRSRHPIEVKDRVQGRDQSPCPDADLEVAADVVRVDELSQTDDLLTILEDAVLECFVVFIEDGLSGSVPTLEGRELVAEIARRGSIEFRKDIATQPTQQRLVARGDGLDCRVGLHRLANVRPPQKV